MYQNLPPLYWLLISTGMKISLRWLNSYLDTPVSAGELERRLTDQGFPIEDRIEAGGGDVVIDAEVTSNRGDCLSHIGMAREVVAGGGGRLVLPSYELDEGRDRIELRTEVANENEALCPLYTARIIHGVKVRPSPAWLVERLDAIGLRSVNNVVDITNFVLFETGQPLHAFDLDRLEENRILVRSARRGEPFRAIDGSQHELSENMLVIADARRAVAVAGVMGGMDAEVGLETTEILLESAIFDPPSIRRTSRALRLASDSSYRFERGVDPLGVESASQRAACFIHELAGGEVCRGVIRVGLDPPRPKVVRMRVARCGSLLGISLSTDTMIGLLGRLGLAPRRVGDDTIECTIPSFRLDLVREVDLIEEVGRLHGLDDIEVRDRIEIVARSVQPAIAARQALGEILIAHGYHETVTFTFLTPEQGVLFFPAEEAPVLVDNLSRRVGTKAEPMLRPSLIPSLLSCRKSNQDVGNDHVRLFEVAATWTRRNGEVMERQRLGLVCDVPDRNRGDASLQVALCQLRGTLEEVASRMSGREGFMFEPMEAPHLKVAARIAWEGDVLGTCGVIDERLQDVFDLEAPVVVAELDLPALIKHYPPSYAVRPLSRFPGIERDLSVVVDEGVEWRAIEREILSAQPALLESIRFIAIYRGKPVPADRKSVSFRMIFRDRSATLRHDQVDGEVASVVGRLKKQLNADLRE